MLCGIVAAAGLMFAPLSGTAQFDQVATQLQPGSRVRLWSPRLQTNPRVGIVHEIHSDEIIVQVEDRAGQIRVQFADIDRLEASVRPASSNVLKGAIWGSVVLLVATVITMTGADIDDGKTAAAGVGAVILIGGGIGALAGWATSSSEQWEEIPLGGPGADQSSVDEGSLFLSVSSRF